MPKFRKKPIVIEAVQQHADGEVFDREHDTSIKYKATDWIITGVKGESYPCTDEIFKATYDPA